VEPKGRHRVSVQPKQRMKQLLITAFTITALIVVQSPAGAADVKSSSATSGPVQGPNFIKKGAKLDATTSAALENKMAATASAVSAEKAGSEASTEVTILAVIGALVVIGAVIYAVNRNNQKE
jgi:hypothetical protein